MRLVFAILFWMLWLHSLWLWSLNFSTEVVLSGVWDMPWLSATTGGWCHPEFVIMWQQTCIWVVSAAAFRPSTWFCIFSLCKKTWLQNIFACFCVWFRAVKHKLNVFDIVIVYLTRLYLLMVVFSVIIYCISTYFLNLISSIAHLTLPCSQVWELWNENKLQFQVLFSLLLLHIHIYDETPETSVSSAAFPSGWEC